MEGYQQIWACLYLKNSDFSLKYVLVSLYLDAELITDTTLLIHHEASQKKNHKVHPLDAS